MRSARDGNIDVNDLIYGNENRPHIQINVGLILQRINVVAQLPTQILSNTQFRLATTHEIAKFKGVLSRGSGDFFGGPEEYFEHAYVEKGNGTYELNKLAPSEWRYYVIEEIGNGEVLHLLDLLSNITEVPLNCSKLILSGNATIRKPAHLANMFNAPYIFQSTTELNDQLLNQLLELHTIYSHIENKEFKDEILRGLNMLDDLGSLSTYSPFMIIGLFAIFELLLTHQPHGKDNSDSISHQLRTKIKLMSNRFEDSICYEEYFGKASHTKVWNALYKFRSLVAHGSNADFSRGELQVLVSLENARSFLKRVLRLLFRQCIKEPQLVADLKLC